MNFCIIMWLRVYGGHEYGAFYVNGPCRPTGSGMGYRHVALLKSVCLGESVLLADFEDTRVSPPSLYVSLALPPA